MSSRATVKCSGGHCRSEKGIMKCPEDAGGVKKISCRSEKGIMKCPEDAGGVKKIS